MSQSKDQPAVNEKDSLEPSDPDNEETQVDDEAETQLLEEVHNLSLESKEEQQAEQKAEGSSSSVAPPAAAPTPAAPAATSSSAPPAEPPKKTLVILRGVAGSGKSTLSKTLLEKANGDGVVMSSDDYFMRNGRYQFDPRQLESAHNWNQQRVFEALKRGTALVIVDNTHTQKWEARPYVRDGLKFAYQIRFVEPDTPWKR